MSQVSQPKSADDILMNIMASNQASSTPAQTSSDVTPATPEVQPVAQVSNTETTSAKSEVTGAEDEESKTTPEASETSIIDWDSEPSEPVVNSTTTAPTYDFSTIGKSIGLEIKSDQELVAEFKKLKEQNEALTKSSTEAKDLFANEVLQKANEIAKNNGDYLGFLGIASIDFDAIPARDLVEDELLSYYESTPENQQKIQSYLDSLDEVSLEMRGAEIRNKRKDEQNFEKNRLIQETEARTAQAQREKQEMDKKVESTLATIKDIDGFVLKPNHKKEIYDNITSGKLYEELFFTDGKFDPSKAITTFFRAKQAEKMIQYYKTRAKVEGKREVISSITNAELDKQGSVVSNGESKSAMDMYIDSLRSGK